MVESRRQGKKQEHNPRFQESRLWPVQGHAWKNPIRDQAGKKRGLRELVDFQGSPPP